MSALIRPNPRPNAARRLVCFSFCGGGTAPFRPWAATVAPDVELVMVCYPGREGRFTEPFAPTWNALAEDAVAALRGLDERPFTLFGHSMGAWLAFDVAVRLAQLGRPQPAAVVASANDAPSRWAAKLTKAPTLADSDEQLLAWMGSVGQLPEIVLTEPDLRRMALDLFRADLRVSDSYRYVPGVRAQVPLHFLHGAEDPDVDEAAAKRWRLLAAAGFTTHELPGGHFYTPETWAALPARVDALTMATA